MPFVKVQKNKAYFKRYQVKYRRRRGGKTDYRARRKLVIQDKNKYLQPRYRFVVRLTNTQVITQIVFSEINGDKVFTSAYSSELPRYGLKTGLKNYAASYATGLLCARRALQKLGMDKLYQGNTKVDGTIVKTTDDKDREFWVAEIHERNPFRAVLDVGTRPTTTGARLFGALKGATDGGVSIPHNEKRFPGYDAEAKKYDPAAHKERIFGGHVAEYMNKLQEEEPEKYQRQFSKYVANDLEGDDLEELYKKVHAAIRADPAPKKKSVKPHNKKFDNPAKRTNAQRKAAVAAKKTARLESLRRGQ